MLDIVQGIAFSYLFHAFFVLYCLLLEQKYVIPSNVISIESKTTFIMSYFYIVAFTSDDALHHTKMCPCYHYFIVLYRHKVSIEWNWMNELKNDGWKITWMAQAFVVWEIINQTAGILVCGINVLLNYGFFMGK